MKLTLLSILVSLTESQLTGDEPLTECAWQFFDYKDHFDTVNEALQVKCRGIARNDTAQSMAYWIDLANNKHDHLPPIEPKPDHYGCVCNPGACIDHEKSDLAKGQMTCKCSDPIMIAVNDSFCVCPRDHDYYYNNETDAYDCRCLFGKENEHGHCQCGYEATIKSGKCSCSDNGIMEMDAEGDCHCTWYAMYVPNWVCWLIHIVSFTAMTLILIYTITFAGRTYFKRYDARQAAKKIKKNAVEPMPQRRHSVMIFVEKNEDGGSSQGGKLPEIEEEEEASIVAMDDTESFHSD